MQTGLGVGGPVSGGVHCRLGGGHPEISGRSHSPRPLSGCKKVPQPSGVCSWITTPLHVSAPPVPVLGPSTVAHTSQDSPSIDQVSDWSRMNVDGSRMGVSSSSVFSAGLPFSASILRIDGTCVLHPFTTHKLDAVPIRLLTIAHAFSYRMAVLRDGVKSAVRI